jgi:hypothetical protein
MPDKDDLDGSIYFAQLGCRRWYHIPESLVANLLKAGAIVKRSQAGTEWETIATSPRILAADA